MSDPELRALRKRVEALGSVAPAAADALRAILDALLRYLDMVNERLERLEYPGAD